MKYLFKIGIMLWTISIVSCSEEKPKAISHKQTKTEIVELIRRGYSIEELEIRTKCPTNTLYRVLDNNEISQDYRHIIDSIYSLDKKGKLISAAKVGYTAKECIQRLFVKAQNLPITSQHTGISAVSICNELTNRKPFTKEDSLRAMVAYIDNIYGYAQIPNDIDVRPYFTDYYNEHKISNIKLPIDYSSRFKSSTTAQKTILVNFINQAEQFELEANKNLEKKINQKADGFIETVTNGFIEKDYNFINTLRCIFYSDDKKNDFYLSKLNERISEANLDSLIRSEIIYYCISINCSRELAVNELLGYKENLNNMNIASNTHINELTTKIKDVNYTDVENADFLTSSASIMINLGTFLVIKNPASLTGLAKIGVNLVTFVNNIFRQKVNGEKLQNKNENLSILLKNLLSKGIADGLNKNKEGYYKESLDENTKAFYEKLRDDFDLK